jgi:hypothetical protein
VVIWIYPAQHEKILLDVGIIRETMATEDALLLKVTDYEDPQHWRWVLTDSSGKILQDHEVSLDPADPLYSALLDLPTYLERCSSPDNRVNDRLRLIKEVGARVGSKVLGKVAKELAGYRLATTVRIQVPPKA